VRHPRRRSKISEARKLLALGDHDPCADDAAAAIPGPFMTIEPIPTTRIFQRAAVQDDVLATVQFFDVSGKPISVWQVVVLHIGVFAISDPSLSPRSTAPNHTLAELSSGPWPITVAVSAMK